MKYDKNDFLGMIEDWKADNTEEMEGLEIDEIEIDEETGEWIAYAHDENSTYSLTDDGMGNIIINYLGTK